MRCQATHKCITIAAMSETYCIIKSLRRAGMSQSEIGRESGMPQHTISRWESGRVPAAADGALKLRQLAAERGVQVVNGDSPAPPTQPVVAGEGANA